MECVQLSFFEEGEKCDICHSSKIDVLNLGHLYKCNGIICHYFCLLFAARLVQNGEDSEGILGFFTKDIREEIKRGRRLRCSYCRKSGATVGCCVKMCKKTFHYPCGVTAGSLHQFFGSFRSYCSDHRPQQKLPKDFQVSSNARGLICPICFDIVETEKINTNLWAPCCRKAWYHRECLQRLAISAGYFFKCPLCNNKESFCKEMHKMGIYIPEMDASWEREPNAFADLLHTHNRCDSTLCKCPNGPSFSQTLGSWRLVRCNVCGSQGTHIACAGLKFKVANNAWRCMECISTLSKELPVFRELTVSLVRHQDEHTYPQPSTEKPVSPSASTSPSLSGTTSPSPSSSTSFPSPSPDPPSPDPPSPDPPSPRSPSKREAPSPKRRKVDSEKEDSSEEIIVVDSDDSDVEVLEVQTPASHHSVQRSSTQNTEVVDKELLTNEGKTIKVVKVLAGPPMSELGGVVVKTPASSTCTRPPSLPPAPVPKPAPTERVELRLGSSVSLFPVPSSSSKPLPKLPQFQEVNIFPIPLSIKKEDEKKPVIKTEALSPNVDRSNQPSRSQSSLNEIPSQSLNIKINDVRHSTEFFPSSPVFPVFYWPITTSDGIDIMQPMWPLQQLQQLQQVPLPPKPPSPDVVTLD